jgi:hypothetical protein
MSWVHIMLILLVGGSVSSCLSVVSYRNFHESVYLQETVETCICFQYWTLLLDCEFTMPRP